MSLIGFLRHPKIKVKDVFIVIFLSSVFIDIANGFMLTRLNFNVPISQIFKSSLLLFFIYYYTVRKGRLDYILATLFLFFIFFIPNLTIYLNDSLNQSNFVQDMIYGVKILYLPIMYMGLRALFENNEICSESRIYWLFNVIFFVVFISIAFSLFGLGNTQYGEQKEGVAFGYKGYFLSGNELSYLYLVAYSFALNRVTIYGKKAIYFILYLIISFVTAIFLATKTAMLAFIFISIFQTILTFLFYKKNSSAIIVKRLKSIKFTLVFLSIPVTSILSFLLYDRFLVYYSRLEFLYHQQGATITSFLLSGRDHRYLDLISMFVDKMNLIDWLFGIGRISYINYTYGAQNQFSAEMDLLDSLISNGIVGSLLIYCYWIYLLFITCKYMISRNSDIAVPTFFSVFLLFSISFIAGHVFASSMVCIYISLPIAYLLHKG
ncbi:hypothetical protein EGC79_13275 [Shewanella vesiculosa]|uniref:O-antigen ligase family protein n=1 Tax=Shewanella vesiculosa TaxID=518738 RepID=UPI000F4FE23C|nr:O-antigen ligase family protein [Shewanella vesiculosa]RPA46606.1 hypothetical protein EGC79_13275 [Shewanella vesiculosa]UJL42923.1 O-antigen ligase family protein [Shewanella vesiculosa]